MANNQLDRLFDYTKFHIGFYATVITGLFAVIAFATQNSETYVLNHLLPYARWTAGLVLVAGAAGGAIASNIPNFENFTTFSRDRLSVFGLPTLRYVWFAHIEHAAFWVAVAIAAYGFLTMKPPMLGADPLAFL